MEDETRDEESLEKEQSAERPLGKMTGKELREIAEKLPGVTGVHAMKKDQLLDIIRETRGIKGEGPARKKKRKTNRPTLSVKELKEKIAQLRQEKEAARGARDKKKVGVLRRRMNRMKKQTRKVAQA